MALFASTLVLTSCASSAPAKKGDNQTHAGVIVADQGYWEEAEFRWLKALAITQNNARALNNLAVRQERLGEFEAAAQYYERALKIATPAERSYIEQNYEQFTPILERISSDDSAEDKDSGDADSVSAAAAAGGASAATVSMPPAAADLPELTLADKQAEASSGLNVLEVLIAVPDQGPNLAGYDRILVGNFVPAPDSETNLNDFAVRYLRRRITQRTFFETQDRLESAMEPELRQPDVFDNRAYWVRAAADVRADLILTGTIGMKTRTESAMVRERIRSPDGEIREVARFQDSVFYTINYDYVVLRGEDGERLLDGTLSAEEAFPADEGVADEEAVFDTLEALLPKVLDTITPRRSEQSRYLIY